MVVALSGGATIRAGAWQIGSRDASRPLLVAVACAAIACALLGATEFRRLARRAAGGIEKAPARIAAAVAVGILIVSIAWNTRAAGGSDSSCYVLQAEAFAQGRVTLRPPLAELPPGLSPVALAPIGFVPASTPPHHAVPICAPGLALAMVPALLAGRDALFLVVPLFAALAVWCTFLLGRAIEDDVTGAMRGGVHGVQSDRLVPVGAADERRARCGVVAGGARAVAAVTRHVHGRPRWWRGRSPRGCVHRPR